MKKLLCTTVGGMLAASAAFADGATLNVATNVADASKLDPHIASSGADKGLLHWMFNGLVRIKPGEGSPDYIEPDIAKSWTSSEDGLTWTFALRDDVECHGDYGAIDAEDVVFSLDRARNPDTSAFAKDFDAIKSVEATDAYEVTIQLDYKIPSLLGLLISYHGGNIVCKDAVEELGEDFVKNPVGTGPFMFAEYVPQQYVRLVANPEYYRGKPKLDEVVLRFIPSDATRDLAFQSGEIDMMIGRGDSKWVARMNELSEANVALMSPGEMSVLSLNKTMPPLDNLLVRQAVAHAIDKEQIVAFWGEGLNFVSHSPVPAGNLGHTNEVARYEHSVEKAKELLTEAGYPDGVELGTIHTINPGMLPTIEAAQAQLAKAGINLSIEPVEHSTFHEQIRKDLSQVTHYRALRFPVADVYLTQFFHSDSIVNTPTGVTNFSHCDAADAEIDAAKSETDPAKQLELWAAAQKKIMDEVCAVPLYQSQQVWVWNKNLDLGLAVNGTLNLSPPVTELASFKN